MISQEIKILSVLLTSSISKYEFLMERYLDNKDLFFDAF